MFIKLILVIMLGIFVVVFIFPRFLGSPDSSGDQGSKSIISIAFLIIPSIFAGKKRSIL